MKDEIIHIGYSMLPPAHVNGKRGHHNKELKYPVDLLSLPDKGFNDSMAVCQYSAVNMCNINSYLRNIIKQRFPRRQFALRKQYVNDKNMVVVYRLTDMK